MSEGTGNIAATRSMVRLAGRARVRSIATPKPHRRGAICEVLSVKAVVTSRGVTSNRRVDPTAAQSANAASHYLSLPTEFATPEGACRAMPVFPQIQLRNAVFLTVAPPSERLFVCERQGRIIAFDNDPAASATETFLDIRTRCQGWDDCGLLGLASHQEFGQAESPQCRDFFVSYQFSDNPRPALGRVFSQHPPTRQHLSRFSVRDGATEIRPVHTCCVARSANPWIACSRSAGTP